VRAWTAALLLLMLLAAPPARGVGFLTQKELVGRDGDTVVVLPPYTYVTVIQRFGDYALVSYRVADEVRELHVRQGDLDAARPDEKQATQTADPAKLLALYRERVPFDVYIEESPPAPSADSDNTTPPTLYRMRIKTRSLFPETISHIRFEVQVYFDSPHRGRDNLLWQLQILAAKPREFQTVQTPWFSAETLRASEPKAEDEDKAGSTETSEKAPPAQAESETETKPEEAAPEPPTMRFAVRLFVDEMFIDQKTGIVKRTDEEEDDSIWTIDPNRAGSSRLRLRIPPKGLRVR
jgi:hypothetical protein